MSAQEARLLDVARGAHRAAAPAAGALRRLRRRSRPRNPYLGVMLPYTPLHHLLMRDLGRPVVATSGNLADEPICTDEREALERLRRHRRSVSRPQPSDRPARGRLDRARRARTARWCCGARAGMRRCRSFCRSRPPPMLAVGAHLKNTVGINVGRSFFISQHIGDLETTQATDAFERVIAAFRDLYRVEPVAGGRRPASRLPLDQVRGTRSGLPVVHVQHHFAHVAACMAENELEGPVLGVSWDGTGYGTDGTIWGGEFLVPRGDSFDRVATLRPFRLPGGDRAIREPRRTAFGLLHEIFRPEPRRRAPTWRRWRHFADRETARSSPRCSTARRQLADHDERGTAVRCRRLAVRDLPSGRASKARPPWSWNSQSTSEREGTYPIPLTPELPDASAFRRHVTGAGARLAAHHRGHPRRCAERRGRRLDRPEISQRARRSDRRGREADRSAARRAHRRLFPEPLSPGAHRSASRSGDGFRPYWHQRVPPNDGGIALGQAVVAVRMARRAARHSTRLNERRSHDMCLAVPGRIVSIEGDRPAAAQRPGRLRRHRRSR